MTKKVPQLNQAESDRSIKRIKQLLDTDLTYKEMADKLNSEGFKTIRLAQWTALNIRQVIWKLRHQERSWYGLSAARAALVVPIN